MDNNKILFLINDEIRDNDGISLKILNQFESFNELCDESHISYVKYGDENGRYIDDNKIHGLSKNKYISHLLMVSKYKDLLDWIKSNNINLVYIRYTQYSNIQFIFFIKRLKANNIKVFIEFPTYPYDSERRNLKSSGLKKLILNINAMQEKITRNFMHKYVTNAISFTKETSIFNMPVYNISNAVSEKLKVIEPQNDDICRIVGVASLEYWHGYDRMINSLSNYYKFCTNPIEVEFHIIGDGKERKYLEQLVHQSLLSNKVFFHGALSGFNLDNVICKANIGVDSLGRFRSGNSMNNSLKSKEYLMRGLPLIKSHSDPSIDGCPYQYTVANDESDFDLESILYWYSQVDFSKVEIREFAEQHFTWKNQLKNLFNS